MFLKRKGVAPLIIVLIFALGLVGGVAAGYGLREPIKKVLSGKTSAEEIKSAIDSEVAKLNQGKDKFELEGVATSVDVSGKQITVKIKSSTNSIKELRLSETPITLSDSTKIISGSKEDLKIGDIPINAQVHVGGTIKDGVLTATKVIIQKEDATMEDDKTNDKFVVSGAVKTVGTDSITVTISSANKKAKDKKGQDLVIKIASATIVEKADLTITLADVKVGDEVQVRGTVADDVYTAANIVVKATQKAEELEEEQNTNQNQGNSTKNKETETEKNNNSNSSPNANSNSNKNE